MAATPSTTSIAVLDDSLNFIAASPALVIQDSPYGRGADLSPTKRLKGRNRSLQRGSLGLKDINSGEGLLVDFGQDHSFSPVAPSKLHPGTPSAFARSLLDKSPSLLKAQLSTPLIPLGTPVTARKKAPTSPSKENATPSARRTARHYRDSPSPTETASTSPAGSPAPVLTVRFSPSPRRTRSSPRKKAAAATPAPGTPSRLPSLRATATLSSPLATPVHHVGLEAPSAAAAHPLAAPFPHFSPSTPAVRTHLSYDTDELTDADADGSIWEDEPSMSYPAPRDARADEQIGEVADADAGLSRVEPVNEPVVGDEVDSGEETEREEAGESSGAELTETEAATSEDEADESLVAKLAEAAAPDSGSAAATTAVKELEEQPSHAEEVGLQPEEPTEAAEEQQQVAVSRSAEPTEETNTAVVADECLEQADEPFEQVESPLPTEPLDAPISPSSSVDSLDPQAAAKPPTNVAVQLDPEAGDASSVERLSDGATTMKECAVEVTSAPAVPQSVASVDLAPSPADPAALPQPNVQLALESQVSPPSPVRIGLSTAEPSTPISTPSSTFSTPAAPVPITGSTPRTTTPSALKPTQPSVSAAPTARRQLTKLTSLGLTRAGPASTSSDKPALTALVPGSAAASRRLAAPSRLALPTKRTVAGLARAEASPAPLRALAASTEEQPESVERTRPACVLSSSTASTSSASSNVPSGSLARPRTILRSGLRPPGTATSASGLLRPTLSSSARPAPAAAPAPTRPPAASASRLTRPLTVPRAAPASAAPPGSRLARSETAATSHPGVFASRTGPSLSAPASVPSVLTNKPTARPPVSLGGGATARAPRAALAVRHAVAPSAEPLQPTAPSPSKRRPARIVDGKLESSPVVRSTSSTPSVEPARAETPTLVHPAAPPAGPASARSPFPAHPHSPPRIVASRPPASPLRSPRRVPINSQEAGSAPPPPTSSSALVAPAEKLSAIAQPAIFEPVVRSAAPRAVRARRTRATEAELLAASAPALPAPATATASSTRTTRRTAATSVVPHAPAPVAAAVAPIVRSARRPARREPSAAEVPAPSAPAPSSSMSAERSSVDVSMSHVRAMPQFHPAPTVTQEELNRLTQRNTKKNQQAFNKLKLETVYIDADRPPSPTSKIRRSFGAGAGAGADAPEVVRAATKAGREARAAKRRNALRASVDGSELAALAAELHAEAAGAGSNEDADAVQAPAAPREHFRAAGDDEQYHTPARAAALKGRASAKKRTAAEADEETGDKALRMVRWDRALVYEGPKEDERPVPDASILKPADLDTWGNSTTATTSFGKAVPVVIRMRVFKDDEQ